MSIKLMSMVFDASGLKPTHKLVLLCLCDFAADDGTSVYPSVALVAHRTALNPSTVRKTIHELRDRAELNLVSIARLYTSKKPNVYKVNVENLRVLCDSARVLPDSTQGATRKHPRVLPHSTDPSVDPSNKPSDDPSESGASAPARQRDPLLKHPAIVIYRDVMHLTPNDLQRTDIADAVGNSPSNLETYLVILKDWKRHGYKPGNIPGQLDAFKNGGLKNGNTKAGQSSPLIEAMHEWQRQHPE